MRDNAGTELGLCLRANLKKFIARVKSFIISARLPNDSDTMVRMF